MVILKWVLTHIYIQTQRDINGVIDTDIGEWENERPGSDITSRYGKSAYYPCYELLNVVRRNDH